MQRYSPFVDTLLSNTSLLKRLRPTELADPIAAIQVREASDAQWTGGRPVTNEMLLPLVRGALLYAVDLIDESYRISKVITDITAVYWCGMIHRREGDFYNARECFRRAGTHPAFGDLHHAASEVSPNMAKQWDWEPYLFVGLCEKEKFGENQYSTELLKLQRIEFDVMLDYVWRKTLGS